MVRIFKGKFGARVLQDMYVISRKKERRRLVAEFYGRELALFQSSENTKSSLKQHLDTVSPNKKQALLNTMKEKLIALLSSKGEAIVGYSLLHTVLWDYLRFALPPLLYLFILNLYFYCYHFLKAR